MATQIALHGDDAMAVYDDRYRCIYEALGVFQVQRATEVEFDHTSGQWLATHIASGTIIGRGSSRNDVIAQEVAWLEANDLRSQRPSQHRESDELKEQAEHSNEMDIQKEKRACHTLWKSN